MPLHSLYLGVGNIQGLRPFNLREQYGFRFLYPTNPVFTSATLSVIFYMAWSQMGRKTFVLLWAITFAIAAVQRLGNIFKDNFPSYDLYWMVVCILSILTVSFGTQGHVQRVGVNVSKPLL